MKRIDKFIFSIPNYYLYLLIILGIILIINGLIIMLESKSERYQDSMYASISLS